MTQGQMRAQLEWSVQEALTLLNGMRGRHELAPLARPVLSSTSLDDAVTQAELWLRGTVLPWIASLDGQPASLPEVPPVGSR